MKPLTKLRKIINSLYEKGYDIHISEDAKSIRIVSIDEEKIYFEAMKPLRNNEKIALLSFVEGLRTGVKLRGLFKEEDTEDYFEEELSVFDNQLTIEE